MSDRTILLLILLIILSPFILMTVALILSWILVAIVAIGQGIWNRVRISQGWKP